MATGLSVGDVAGIDVHLPPSSLFVPGVTGHEHTPYIIEVIGTDGSVLRRAYRSYRQLQALRDELVKDGIKVGSFPEPKKLYLISVFGASFITSAAGEQRRQGLASYLNAIIREGESFEQVAMLLFSWLDGVELAKAIRERREDEVVQLIDRGIGTEAPPENPLACPLDVIEQEHGFTALHVVADELENSGSDADDKKLGQIAERLLERKGDVTVVSKDLRSPLQVCLSALDAAARRRANSGDAKGDADDLEDEVEDPHSSEQGPRTIELGVPGVLLKYGADAAEKYRGATVAHLLPNDVGVMDVILQIAPRVLHLRNDQGKTPLDLLDAGNDELKLMLTNSGAPLGSDMEAMDEMVKAEISKLEGFLSLAEEGGDHREQVALVTQMADVYLINEPILAAKLYNCAIKLAADHEVYEEMDALYAKIVQVELRLFAIYNRHELKLEADKYTATQRKRAQQVESIRANYITKTKQLIAHELQSWLSGKIEGVLKSVLRDVFSLQEPPCPYAVVLLGDLGRGEVEPDSLLEYAVLVQNSSFTVLEHIRLLCEILRVRIGNLGETEHPLLQHGTKSPIAKGFQIDDNGNIPCRAGRSPAFRLVATPEQLAQLQEQRFFDVDPATTMDLAMGMRYVHGDKKLFVQYQEEVQRVLNRCEAASNTMLRHTRAETLIRSETGRFRPQYNQAPDDEKFLDFRPIMALPYKTIRYLALFFGGPHDERTSTHDLVDVLVGQKCFSKKGGSNLKAAIDLIDKIRVAARGQTRFDMRRVVKQVKEKYAARKAAEQQANEQNERQNDEEDASDDGGASGNGEEDAEAGDTEKEEGEAEEALAEEEEGEARTANAESEVYHLSLEDVDDLLRVYQTLIPFWKCVSRFSRKNKNALEKNNLLDTDNRTTAEAYFRMCLYLDAEDYYLKAAEEHPEDSTLFNEIGMMWNKMGDYKKSIEWFLKTVDLIRRQGPELSGAYTNIGMCYVHMKEYAEAVQWLQKALKVDQEVHGEEHLHVAQDHHYLGKICHRGGELHDAAKHLKEALRIQVKVRGEISPEAGRYSSDLGSVFQELRNNEEAAKHFEASVRIEGQVWGANHENVAKRLQPLAQFHVETGQLSNALEAYERIVRINLKAFGERHQQRAQDLYHLGYVHWKLGSLEIALGTMQNALKVCEKVIEGADHPLTKDVRTAIEKIESELAERSMSPEEYEAWKRKMAEERERRLAQSALQVEEPPAKAPEATPQPKVEKEAQLFTSGVVGKAKVSVFDDDFFDL